MLLDKMRYCSPVPWFYSWSGGNILTMQEWNNFGLSLCTVSQSSVAYVVAYSRVVEHCLKEW